jgi:hypothetical protein
LLTVFISAALLVVVIIAFWIAFVVIRWNDWYGLTGR